ncbi:MAG: glutamate 5-kinase [Gammaproteobacteria bacterium]|nr:glutamate 5-kinase [Gammaproteobacteria bacterium]
MATEHWAKWQRAVIKVGSALIAPDGKQVSGKYVLPIAKFISDSIAKGKEIILVSSGSVAAGRGIINSHEQGATVAEKQAMAAVGQARMMANWQRFFDFDCAQLLITHGDLRDRRRYVNIKNTVRELLANKVLPIINENDTVATQELRVGDNDNLAAMVALVCEADALFICSDIDGLYDADPRTNKDAKLLPVIDKITADVYKLAGDTNNKIATGGMKTKLQAAERTTTNGIHTFIVNGKKDAVFTSLNLGEHSGTWFKAVEQKDNAKKQWLKHTLKPSGKILVDAGAAKALNHTGASLLAKGIIRIEGDFTRGDAVDIVLDGNPIGRGLCQYTHNELALILGKESCEFENILGFKHKNEIIHRDDFVLFK